MLVAVITCVTLILVACLSLLYWRKKISSKSHRDEKSSQHYIDDNKKIEGNPTLFPYSVLKTATNNFDPSTKLGQGGFGSVFKGVLPDGMEVAVKQLSSKSQQGKGEFLNEVTLITSVQHRNLVQLRGCCLKDEERLLVYEYLPNRSVYQALFNAPVKNVLDWRARRKILEGTARGLAYLHEGCHTRIVHRDIKASNILLDKDLNPKIADFGLARIFSENDTHVNTRVAGTAGYVAPEYAMRGQLTEKADVFSYGIVALELISGRHNLEFHPQSHATYILDWARQLYEESRLVHLLDPALTWCNDTIEESIRVIEMALLCSHSRATLRPSMSNVVTILTGGSEVVIPKLERFDVRDYADPGFKFSESSENRTLRDGIYTESGRLRSSVIAPCGHSFALDGSNVSVLEPR